MGRNVRYGATVINAAVDAAADQPAPTNPAPDPVVQGTAYPRRHDVMECLLLITGNGSLTAGDTITVRPWWYDPTSGATGRWLRGATTTVTDDGAVLAYCIGERIYWEVTAVVRAVAGEWLLSQQFINKSA